MDEAVLEELDERGCLAGLSGAAVARLGFVLDDRVLILPVNHRVVDARAGGWEVLLRTRPGAPIDLAPRGVALEVDGVDPVRRVGWSVLVEGDLLHIAEPDRALRWYLDPEPWIEDQRDAWLALVPQRVTGRRLVRPAVGWAFDARAYL